MLPKSPTGQTQALTKTTVFRLTASQFVDPQVSYDDHYLVFQDGSRLEVYDFNQKKVIWQTVPRRHGKILAYQWLPDREALLLFESGVGANPNRPGQGGVGIYSLEFDAGQNNVLGNSNGGPVTGAATSQSGVVERYATSLPTTMQWDKITQVSLSTATNLLYFLAEQQGQSYLYEVDVMKNLKVLGLPGEQVAHLAASPSQGALYYDAMDHNRWQIVAEKAGRRVQVASNPLDTVMGIWNGKLYLGTVQNGELVKVWTVTDNQPSAKKPDFSLRWQGQVPWDSSSSFTVSGQSLLVSSLKGIYRLNSAGSTRLAQGTNFFSDSGTYYYTLQGGSSGIEIKRNPL